MIIKNLLAELELQLSDIAFSGLRNIQPVTLQKLEDLKHWMNELNMSEAIRLTDRFIRFSLCLASRTNNPGNRRRQSMCTGVL